MPGIVDGQMGFDVDPRARITHEQATAIVGPSRAKGDDVTAGGDSLYEPRGYRPVPPMPGERPSLDVRFAAYHAENPQVYVELARLARKGVRAGATKLGIAQLFEVLRWERMLTTNDPEGFKLNNNYKPGYARMLMEREPDLEGVFDLRHSSLDEAS